MPSKLLQKIAAAASCTVFALCLVVPALAAPSPAPSANQAGTAVPPAPTGQGPSVYAESIRVGVNPACWSNGNCSLQDLMMTAAAFANILIELSGALFLLTFVYGGARYLISFGKKGSIEKGTTAMKGGAIGMVIVMAAWTIVTYLTKALAGK